ncbi:MAG: thymidine phosphorylase [Myxococcota bacterium]
MQVKSTLGDSIAGFSTTELIAKKRDGEELPPAEIGRLVEGFVSGEITDYQMSAFAMAVYFQGMTPSETTALTLAMRDSGEVVDLSGIQGIKVDKHSTGGVGDKISICLAPLVAACGVPLPMISGRGLGHTGGTLDKLEAIPGFHVALSTDAYVRQIHQIGCALIGQTADIVPADKRLYALRDVTATVESIPLIVSSILSKKLAAGVDALVLDVKVGRGAFMKTLEDARRLARLLVQVGTLAGKNISAVLTDMDAPLGNAVGNALETREAFEVLLGRGPEDVRELTLVLGVEMLLLGNVESSEARARKRLEQALVRGRAATKMEEIIKAQHGDPRVVREHDRLPAAPHLIEVTSTQSGYVTRLDAFEVGQCSVALGAGRNQIDDEVDPAVGIELKKHVGDRVEVGTSLAVLHVRDCTHAAKTLNRIQTAYTIGTHRNASQTRVLEYVRE